MTARTDIVIVGAGVAGLEAALALRALAGDRVALTLVAPEHDFVYRPMTVAEPFDDTPASRLSLARFAEDVGARLVQGRAIRIAPDERRILLRSGDRLGYGTLLLAPGARTFAPFDEAITFGAPGSGDAMRRLVADAATGTIRSVAFIAPESKGWTLPLYELALLTAATCRARAGRGVELTLITPEPAPLAAFGEAAACELERLLAEAGIEYVGDVVADVRDGRVVLGRGGELAPDRVVTLPLLRGPRIHGVPGDRDFGFIPVDARMRVTGLDDAFAAGDATTFGIKQGGLAAQQAETAARHIAARAGADAEPAPLRPVLRGRLLTGDRDRFLRVAGDDSALSMAPLWWPPTKVAGRFLGPYLAAYDPDTARVAGQTAEAADRRAGAEDSHAHRPEAARSRRSSPLGRTNWYVR